MRLSYRARTRQTRSTRSMFRSWIPTFYLFDSRVTLIWQTYFRAKNRAMAVRGLRRGELSWNIGLNNGDQRLYARARSTNQPWLTIRRLSRSHGKSFDTVHRSPMFSSSRVALRAQHYYTSTRHDVNISRFMNIITNNFVEALLVHVISEFNVVFIGVKQLWNLLL